MTEPRDDNELPAAPPLSDSEQRRPRFGPISSDGTNAPPNNRMPVAALVLGIASIPFGLLTGFLGIACGLAAIIVGILGIRKVRRGIATKQAFAIAGVVAGFIGIVVSIVVLVISVHRINECKKHIGHTPSRKELTQCARNGY